AVMKPTPRSLPASIDATLDLLAAADYLADRSLATVLFLALKMGRPLFLEGEAGVGKTEIAKVLSSTLGRHLIRLQCYEGLDVSAAVYEWNYAAQMIAIRVAEAEGAHDRERLEHDVFSERFLIKRPLLQALEPDPAGPPVLLIDELDRADEAFEAFLLEGLADFQVTIPELGTVKAAEPPIVVIPANRTREIHEGLKRRCLYHWVGYPVAERELKIVRAKVPGIGKILSEQVVHFVQALRKEDLFKAPGVAETLDWAAALAELDVATLDPLTVSDTLGVLLKYQDDIARIEGAKAKELIDEVRAELRAAEEARDENYAWIFFLRPATGFRGGSCPRHGAPPRARREGWRPSCRKHRPLRPRLARRRDSSRSWSGDGRAGGGRGGWRRHPRRLLLGAACGIGEAPPALAHVRPGVPHLLSPAWHARQAARGHAAAGAVAGRREAAARCPAHPRGIVLEPGRSRAQTPGSRGRRASHRIRPRGAADEGFCADDGGGDRGRQGGNQALGAAARRGEAATPCPPPARPARRHPPYPARKPESRRRGDRPQISRAAVEIAAARGAAGYFRLHEPVHAAVSALP